MFSALFGKPTAAGEVGERFAAQCKAAVQRQSTEASAMETSISQCMSEVTDKMEMIDGAIKLQVDVIADAQRSKNSSADEMREHKSVRSRFLLRKTIQPTLLCYNASTHHDIVLNSNINVFIVFHRGPPSAAPRASQDAPPHMGV